MKYLLQIAYKGTNYCGWQVQPNGVTVQRIMCEAAEKVLGAECAVTGCSRTDSGVHAKKYFCTVEPLSDNYNRIPPDRLPDALNSALPDDIAAKDAKTVDDSFHPRYSAKGKEYVYLIRNERRPDPFAVGLAYHLPHPKLDIQAMNEAAEHYIGRHDFRGCSAAGSSVEDAVRTVAALSVSEDDGLVAIRISADGFLYNMVRIIAGTLVEVGLGKIPPGKIPEIIASRDRSQGGPTLPACGLYLNEVYY
ncbi:MAG: tRNA pseudouridine(38-40) synthase TruA [Clostridia bacterium]|nr:tRNA pseudouridine(38-40) synthase TruA [Clostridia bacterium]